MLKNSTFAFVHHLSNLSIEVFRLGTIVPTFPAASNSVILSLAAFFTWKYPKIPHPLYNGYSLLGFANSDTFPSSELSYHPLYEAWCDLMCESILQGNAIRKATTLYLTITVDSAYAKILTEMSLTSQIMSKYTKIHDIFGVQPVEAKNKKIMLMNFATSQLRQDLLLPKIHLPSLLMGTLFNNEIWSLWPILKGKIPSKNEILSADTLIFPGSSNSVLDSIIEVDSLVQNLIPALSQNKSLKILSICYGHQLVAKLYGSKIVKKTRFEGHETVKFNKKIAVKHPFLKGIVYKAENQFIMPQHHEDYVESLPEDFELIASSKSCFVQAMVSKNGRIFSLQFHPEYLSQYTIAFTKRSQSASVCSLANFALQISEQKLPIHHNCCTTVRECIKQFIEYTPIPKE